MAKYCFTVVNNISRVERRDNVFIDEDPTIDHFYPRSIELAVIKRGRGELHVKNNLAVLEEQIDAILKNGRRPRIKKHAKCCRT